MTAIIRTIVEVREPLALIAIETLDRLRIEAGCQARVAFIAVDNVSLENMRTAFIL